MSTRCLCNQPAKAIHINERVFLVCATPRARRPVPCVCKTQTCVCAASRVKCKFKLDYQTYAASQGVVLHVDITAQPDPIVVSNPVSIPVHQQRCRPSRRAAQRQHAV